jgi:hypothetical protein
MPLSKSYLGVKNAMRANRFTTIQSIRTHGKWGRISRKRRTWITGGSTKDRATYFNRNYIYPLGRTIGFGQLQYLQNDE